MTRISRQDARHEAAHAVVSVRLGLPLHYTSVGSGHHIDGLDNKQPPGVKLTSLGFTTLVPGTVDRWVAALPSPASIESLEKFACQAAAGIAAEMQRGASLGDMALRDDVHSVVQIAGLLGVGKSTDDPAVMDFIKRVTVRATDCLLEDDRTAWERVTTVLLRKKRLSGDAVREIVAGSE